MLNQALLSISAAISSQLEKELPTSRSANPLQPAPAPFRPIAAARTVDPAHPFSRLSGATPAGRCLFTLLLFALPALATNTYTATISKPPDATVFTGTHYISVSASAIGPHGVNHLALWVDGKAAYSIWNVASFSESQWLSFGKHSLVVQASDSTGHTWNSATANVTLGHQVKLSWQPSSSTDVVGYRIYRGTQSGGPYTLVNWKIIDPSTTFTDKWISSGVTYFYVVTAISSSGKESGYSSEIKAAVPYP